MNVSSRSFGIVGTVALAALALWSCGRSMPTSPARAEGQLRDGAGMAYKPGTASDNARTWGGPLRLRAVRMDIVQLVPGIGDLASLADALALLEHPGSAATRSLSLSGPISFSDFEGDCCVVYRPYRPWEDLVPIPGNGRPAPDQFVVRLRGQIVVPELEDDERADAASHNPGSVDNVWTLAVASDDGFRLKVVTSAGRTHEERPGRRARTEWTAENTQPRGIAVGPLLSIRFPKRGGTFPFELVYFERAGGAILHLAAAPGSRDTFDANSFAVVEATRQILPQGGDGHGER